MTLYAELQQQQTGEKQQVHRVLQYPWRKTPGKARINGRGRGDYSDDNGEALLHAANSSVFCRR